MVGGCRVCDTTVRQLCFDRCSLKSTSKHSNLYIRFMLHKHTEGARCELGPELPIFL